MAPFALQGQHLRRTFGEGAKLVTVLDDVSLDIGRGEFVLLMGPSGSGKSTLMAVLSGILAPNAGRVLALGKNLWAMSDQEREYFRLMHSSFIFQGYDLFPALTARQQVEIVLRWGEGTGAREARKRADKALGLMGLTDKGHLRPCEMSGGERQRVAVARALVKKPTFCFADEPTGALDWANGQRVIELLHSAAHTEGATVLVVGHDERIIPYADQIYYLDSGHLRRLEGRELVAKPTVGIGMVPTTPRGPLIIANIEPSLLKPNLAV